MAKKGVKLNKPEKKTFKLEKRTLNSLHSISLLVNNILQAHVKTENEGSNKIQEIQ
jgi:hypothetical protein